MEISKACRYAVKKKATALSEQSESNGFSLIEMLVVMAVFAVLTVVMTQVLFVTIRGSKKSDATVRVRQNLESAVSSMERQLHNAVDVPVCPNPDVSTLTLEDINNETTIFSCINIGNNGYIASNSARLTSTEIIITSCSITCAGGGTSGTKSVLLNITAADAAATGSEKATMSITDRVFLRSY